MIEELIYDVAILDRLLSKPLHHINLLELESAACVLNRHDLPPVMSIKEARRELAARVGSWRAALDEESKRVGLS